MRGFRQTAPRRSGLAGTAAFSACGEWFVKLFLVGGTGILPVLPGLHWRDANATQPRIHELTDH